MSRFENMTISKFDAPAMWDFSVAQMICILLSFWMCPYQNCFMFHISAHQNRQVTLLQNLKNTSLYTTWNFFVI